MGEKAPINPKNETAITDGKAILLLPNLKNINQKFSSYKGIKLTQNETFVLIATTRAIKKNFSTISVLRHFSS